MATFFFVRYNLEYSPDFVPVQEKEYEQWDRTEALCESLHMLCPYVYEMNVFRWSRDDDRYDSFFGGEIFRLPIAADVLHAGLVSSALKGTADWLFFQPGGNFLSHDRRDDLTGFPDAETLNLVSFVSEKNTDVDLLSRSIIRTLGAEKAVLAFRFNDGAAIIVNSTDNPHILTRRLDRILPKAKYFSVQGMTESLFVKHPMWMRSPHGLFRSVREDLEGA